MLSVENLGVCYTSYLARHYILYCLVPVLFIWTHFCFQFSQFDAVFLLAETEPEYNDTMAYIWIIVGVSDTSSYLYINEEPELSVLV
jgi:hypothetical protein